MDFPHSLSSKPYTDFMDHINHSRFPIPPDQRESHHISFEQETLEILYGSFFSNANVLERFRALQVRTSALVSGPLLFRLFPVGKHIPSCLQIYAYHSQVTSLYTFFMDIGFALHDTISTDEGAYRLSSPSGKTVVIYGTHKEPIDEILDLPCTSAMNFATHDQVVFLYPATTFIRKQSLLLQKSIVPSLLHHFELNGLGMITMISALDALGSQSELSLKCRWIGDRHCLRLQLPALRCAETPTAMNTLKTTSWHLHCAEPNLVIVKKTSIHASNPPSTFTVAPYMEEIMLCWYISDEGLDSDHAPETTDKVLILPPYSCRNADTRGRTPPTSRSSSSSSIDTERCSAWLSSIYPFITDAFDSNFAIRIMNYHFLRTLFSSGNLPLETVHPTGYVVSSILQCLQEVSCTCRIIHFYLYSQYQWDAGAISTTCVIQIPEGSDTQQLTDDWRFRDLCSGNLTVTLTSG